MVFYRKYRPQTINQLDSSHVRELLSSILSSPNIPHAFLFTGPKGLGKTSTARIVAKIINCTNLAINQEPKTKNKEQKGEKILSSGSSVQSSEGIEPCNTCSSCVSIENGTNMDVLEIDAASNRGIDEIRDLREKVKLSPVSSRKKVYIIDEVHMLTTEAFNALLKTLEEPPPHVIFILCTTESHKIPSTIVSRCFHIPFSLATTEELVRSFKRIADGEKMKIDNDTLSYIATLADGAFRDGAKVLEELSVVAKGAPITKAFVQVQYKTTTISHFIDAIIKSFEKRETKTGLQVVSEIVSVGIDMKFVLLQLINRLHESLLEKVGVGVVGKVPKTVLSTEEIKKLTELLTDAHAKLKYAVLPQLPLELVIIEWGTQARNHAEQNTESRGNPIISPSTLVTPRVDVGDDFWPKFIEHVKKENHAIAGVLRGCKLQSIDDKKVIIEAGYTFHRDKLSTRETLNMLESVVKEMTGSALRVEVVLKG